HLTAVRPRGVSDRAGPGVRHRRPTRPGRARRPGRPARRGRLLGGGRDGRAAPVRQAPGRAGASGGGPVTAALTVGILVAGGVYLMLRRDLLRVTLGFVLLGHAVNVLFVTGAGLNRRAAPLLKENGAEAT